MMNKYVLQAYKGLTRQPGRTMLTVLGIVIGVAVVIMVFSAGEGFKSYINSQVDQFGSNTIFIQTRVPPSTKDIAKGKTDGGDQASNAIQIKTLTTDDIEAVKRLKSVGNAYGVATVQRIVTRGEVSSNTFVLGADSGRFEIDGGELSKGRFFTEEEDRGISQVAILGSTLAETLFAQVDPIGSIVRVGELNFTVIGVYKPRGGFDPVTNTDKQILIPLRTLQKKMLGIDYLFYAVAQSAPDVDNTITSLDISDLIRERHHIDDPVKDDFKVSTQEESMKTFNTILAATQFLLLAIAAISLVVGGVGVMNIMYVIVTERIAEIGLKKALGGTNKDILYEFLFEAIGITCIGGVLGVLLGIGLSYLIALAARGFLGTWAFSVPLAGVVVSLVVSITIGLVFGVFPARNASRKDPIEALRYE